LSPAPAGFLTFEYLDLQYPVIHSRIISSKSSADTILSLSIEAQGHPKRHQNSITIQLTVAPLVLLILRLSILISLYAIIYVSCFSLAHNVMPLSDVANFVTDYFRLKIKFLAKRKREFTTKLAILLNGG
jgi:hypothetical protein